MKAVILPSPVSTVYARNPWDRDPTFGEHHSLFSQQCIWEMRHYGKAFYIVFRKINLGTVLVVFGCCLLVAVTKFHYKSASLGQVNSSNSQEIEVSNVLCRHVFGTTFSEFCSIFACFVNFAGFCGFTWNLQRCDRAKYQKPCNETLKAWKTSFLNLILILTQF